MKLHFADCTLDLDSYSLHRGGAEVHVEPKVFDVIVALVRAEGRLVTYDALIAAGWGGRIVSDSAVSVALSAARAAVGDDGKAQKIFRTVPRRGVQLAVPVIAPGPGPQPGTGAPARAQGQRLRFARAPDGTGLAWAVSGDGPPVLRGGHWLSHLDHDWTSPVWRPFLDRLGAAHRLVRYDPRGTGLSDRDPPGWSLSALTDDMEAVAEAAGLDRFAVVAASQSAPVALALAARHPGRITRMVLINGFARGSTARGDAQKTEAMVAMIRSGWGQPGSAFMKAFATVFMPEATPEELDDLTKMQALSATPAAAAALRRAIGDIDVTELLPRIETPTLVQHVTRDAVQPFDEGRALALGLPNAEFRQYDGGNHVPVPSAACYDAMCADMLAFLAG